MQVKEHSLSSLISVWFSLGILGGALASVSSFMLAEVVGCWRCLSANKGWATCLCWMDLRTSAWMSTAIWEPTAKGKHYTGEPKIFLVESHLGMLLKRRKEGTTWTPYEKSFMVLIPSLSYKWTFTPVMFEQRPQASSILMAKSQMGLRKLTLGTSCLQY